MSKKIVGVTVGTPISPAKLREKMQAVKTVNGVSPDVNGNVVVDGGGGGSGVTFTPSVSSDGTLTWSNDGGLTNPASVNIKGKDGETPTEWTLAGRMTSAVNGQITVTLYENGAKTTKTAYLSNLVSSGNAEFREHAGSKDAFTGEKTWGYSGTDGGIYWLCRAYEDSARTKLLASCYVAVSATATPYDVAKKNGFTGSEAEWLETLKGQDGSSPSVSVSTIPGGHTVTIKDADGEHSFDVMNGEDGTGGSGGGITEADRETLITDVIAAFPRYAGEVSV